MTISKKSNLNNKKAVLAQIFDQELAKLPIFLLPNGCLMYKDYKITKTATGMWKLSRQGKSLFEYNLRASALVAASFESKQRYSRLPELKMYDQNYALNSADCDLFSQRLKREQNIERIDTLTARLDIAKTRADYNKKKISAMFNTAFDK